ncbi:ABC transporter permease subunit [Propioniciclava coleopterorum]|uniref:ABC transporter permease subunit n=1 Tax=Propioniciclava coleopterorum TaxID=2714937 RepID=A0A6G7Y2Q5_9ACTN|nr:ABC transporter permease subunit [Propioniciclava coleopterorum]QIK71095.1 ABC transporter permease subunit [Propioniciclava coleopterorum]
MTDTLDLAPARSAAPASRPRFVDLLRSEWIKLWSLPAALLCLLALAAIGFGGPLFLGLTLESSQPPSTASIARTMGEVTMPLVVLGQILAGILGVLCISSEYASGTIASTLLAAPTRLRSLLAKAVLLFGVVTVVALVTVVAAWAVTYPMYAPFGLEAPLTAHGVVGSLVGTGVYLGLCSVFGLGLGAVLRSTAAGSFVVFFAMLLGPILSSMLPYNVASRVIRLLLIGNAGDAMSRVDIPGAPFLDLMGGHISPAAGYLLVGGWTLLALVCGAAALLRRDA